MPAGSPRISCAFAVFDVGKPHAMGVGERDACKIESLSTGNAKASDRSLGFSVGKSAIAETRRVDAAWAVR
jgi:hypothetical protein